MRMGAMFCPQQYGRLLKVTDDQEEANAVFVLTVNKAEQDWGKWFGSHAYNFMSQTSTLKWDVELSEQQEQNIETARRCLFQYNNTTVEGFAMNQRDPKLADYNCMRFLQRDSPLSVIDQPDCTEQVPARTDEHIWLRDPANKSRLIDCCQCWVARDDEDALWLDEKTQQQVETQWKKKIRGEIKMFKENLTAAWQLREFELRYDRSQGEAHEYEWFKLQIQVMQPRISFNESPVLPAWERAHKQTCGGMARKCLGMLLYKANTESSSGVARKCLGNLLHKASSVQPTAAAVTDSSRSTGVARKCLGNLLHQASSVQPTAAAITYSSSGAARKCLAFCYTKPTPSKLGQA
eukprot:g25637.t1